MTDRLRVVGPAAIVAAVVAVPLFYVPRADSPFADPKLAVLLIAGGVGLAAWVLAWGRGARQAGGPALRAGLAAVVGTTLLAAAVAAVRGPPGAPYALGEIARLAAIVGAAAAAAQAARDAVWRRRLFEAIAIAAGLVSLLGLLQHLRLLPFALPIISVPGSTFGNRNMGGEAVAMSLPFLLAVLASRSGRAPRPWLAVGLLLLALIYLAATRARGAWIGAAAGLAAYLAVRRPSVSRRGALLALPIGAAVLLAVVLPGRWQPRDARDTKRYEPGARVVLDAVDPTSSVVRTRLGLWRRTLAVYREHPLTGVGPGNFSVLFPRYAEPGAAADGVMSATMVPRRPHNELLERLTETGPLGLAAFVGLCAAAFVTAGAIGRAARAQPARTDTVGDLDAAAAGAGGVAASLGCGLTAFPLAMPATALLFGVALGVLDALAPAARGAARADPPAPARPRRGAAVVAAAIVVGACWLSSGVLASSYWRGQARVAVGLGTERQPDLPVALAALARAARAPRLDYARFDIALRTAQLSLKADRAAPAREAADRALVLEPYSPHAWAARAAAELALGDEAPAARDATRALTLFSELPLARATLDGIRRLERTRAGEAGGRAGEVHAP
ncbi:MAG TPA: O-antigen ligase family protein [Polyangia bacterium]|jgi:O-antigen ligase